MNKIPLRILSLITLSITTLTLGSGVVLAQGNDSRNSNQNIDKNYYTVDLTPLNNSGVTGKGLLSYENNELTVNILANGLTPLKVHPQHIHGKDNPEVALCPTTKADTNSDGKISVIEGAPFYGPIKLNLTNPQTPFGKSPTPALFSPFAGTPDNNNFPIADISGKENFSADYSFDGSDDARKALQTLMPLEDQHVVLHGDMAPESVDAAAFTALGLPSNPDSSKLIYDSLLPVACGSIHMVTVNKRVHETHPYIILDAYNGFPGTNISIKGYDFSPNNKVIISTSNDDKKIQALTDHNGNFIQSLIIPLMSPQLLKLTATDEYSSNQTFTNLNINGYYPNIELSNYYVLPGQPITIKGKNFPPNEIFSLKSIDESKIIAKINSDNNGNLNETQIVPSINFKDQILHYELQDQLSSVYTISNSFTIKIGKYNPQISPSSYYMSKNDKLNISGYGFAKNEMTQLFINDTKINSSNADDSGNINYNNLPLSSYGNTIVLTVKGLVSNESNSKTISVY